MPGLPVADPGPRLDPAVPHSARVYGYWLGGKDHYPADREVAEEVIRRRPQVVAGARANRAFLARVVRHLAGGWGIHQFLDIGTGLPAPDSTHEVAQDITPDCRVVYADNDPLVLVHARALLTSSPRGSCDYVDADLRDTATVLAGAACTLDFTQPVAVLLRRCGPCHAGTGPDRPCGSGLYVSAVTARSPFSEQINEQRKSHEHASTYLGGPACLSEHLSRWARARPSGPGRHAAAARRVPSRRRCDPLRL